MSDFTLSDLEAIVARRAAETDGSSYTARLVAGGPERAAKKLGEEATEAIIAAVAQDEKALRDEAADLLYHLLVVLKLRGVPLAEVMAELERRTAQTGLEEKAARGAPGAGGH
ncbi:phosphoribosyl-ATP diphosphatase [Aureimonas mangrovi]|uniref:phosphoribosyl-ATP diphosphatase n=1 Tax=Aureimonas mangrovi TaxID=2758041 RepID=UPI00163D4F83|nr:phosphoribosyl-ATP diphosphatase [Aureimonas mangrovi]